MKLKYREAVFIVSYRKDKKTRKILYLLLHRYKHWKGWEFPKGGIEKESPWKTAKREVMEETGLKILRLKKYNFRGRYKYPHGFPDRQGIIGQTYMLFSAELAEGNVKIDKGEHLGYVWLPFNKALARLRHENQKQCLKIVDSRINS